MVSRIQICSYLRQELSCSSISRNYSYFPYQHLPCGHFTNSLLQSRESSYILLKFNYSIFKPPDKPNVDEINKKSKFDESSSRIQEISEGIGYSNITNNSSISYQSVSPNASYSPNQQFSSLSPPQESSYVYTPKPLISTSSILADSNNTALKKRVDDWGDKFNAWYEIYQSAAGISDVRESQEKVSMLMDSMSAMSSRRRDLQTEIAHLHQDLNAAHSRITNSPRYSQEHTLLFEQARDLTSNLDTSKREFDLLEGRERDCLTQVMSAIRESHEKERNQQQHTNYRTLVISVVSACIASVVTFITNIKRTRDTNLRIQQTEHHASQLHQLHLQQLQLHHTHLEHRLDQLQAAVVGTAGIGGGGGDTDTNTNNSNRQQHTEENVTDKLTAAMILTNDTDVTSGSRGEALPLPPGGNSVYQITAHMATGAVLGTLMTAIIFSGFR